MDLATIGHNKPPEGEENPTVLRLKETYSDIVARVGDLEGAAERVPDCDGEENKKKISDYIKAIRACAKLAEAERKKEKQPWLDGGAAVDGFFKGLVESINAIMKECNNRVSAYDREKEAEARKVLAEKAEADRKAAEAAAEAARVAADNLAGEADLGNALEREQEALAAIEEAERSEEAAEVSAADLSRTRSEEGSVGSLRSNWKPRNIDRATVDLEALRPYFSMADIEKAARGFVRAGGRELKGAEIYDDKRTVIK